MTYFMGGVYSNGREIAESDSYRKLVSDYRVVVTVNDSAPRVLQAGRGAAPPVLRFHFANSAFETDPRSAKGMSED